MEVKKRKYTKPTTINRVYTKKPYEEKMIIGFYYVKGRYKKEADKMISEIIRKWR